METKQQILETLCIFFMVEPLNMQEAVAKWPPLRPLCLILKVFLQQRELNEV